MLRKIDCHIRLTEEEYIQIKKIAYDQRKTLSEIFRNSVFIDGKIKNKKA